MAKIAKLPISEVDTLLSNILSDKPISDMTNAELADAWGDLQNDLKPLKKREELLREAIVGRVNKFSNGLRFRIEINESQRELLDGDKIKADMPASWLASHTKKSTVKHIKIVKK